MEKRYSFAVEYEPYYCSYFAMWQARKKGCEWDHQKMLTFNTYEEAVREAKIFSRNKKECRTYIYKKCDIFWGLFNVWREVEIINNKEIFGNWYSKPMQFHTPEY